MVVVVRGQLCRRRGMDGKDHTEKRGPHGRAHATQTRRRTSTRKNMDSVMILPFSPSRRPFYTGVQIPGDGGLFPRFGESVRERTEGAVVCCLSQNGASGAP